jgi:hypothetical protein
VDIKRVNRNFIKSLRLHPLFLVASFGIAYALGGFSDNPAALLPKSITYDYLTLVLAVAPMGFMIGFIVIGRATDKKYLQNSKNQANFAYEDAFQLPSENMHGFKLAFITGREPILTGITGDSYRADDTATCGINPAHVPPVKDCQCGFHAFKELTDAKFEGTLYRGAFLMEVDLYGIGFVYSDGFRAETQLVNQIFLPAHCMRCKIFPVRRFTGGYQLQSDYSAVWQWEARCWICSSVVKRRDRMEISEMANALSADFQLP